MNLRIEKLNKTYSNGVKALNNLTLEISKGMFGLLGPNGAGKSTLMRTIATLQNPDSGSIHFYDIDVLKDPMELRKKLGYLPQDFGVYPGLTAESLLLHFARLKGMASKVDRSKAVQRVLELTNLYDVRKNKVSGYSGGMKQRFGIAQLLLNDPQLIIVDEPTAGLDPTERTRFLNVLRDVGVSNTVIFSTHIVDDVKELCTDMAIVNGGKVLMHQKPNVALSELSGLIWTKKTSKSSVHEDEKKFKVLSSSYNEDHSLNIRVYSENQPEESFTSVEPNLEDIYFIALNHLN
ncbi:MAG: ABC transporter ATP-binding protein [Bacteroidota bacterium]